MNSDDNTSARLQQNTPLQQVYDATITRARNLGAHLSRRLYNKSSAHVTAAGRYLQDLTPNYFPIVYKLTLVITSLIVGGIILLGMLITNNQTRLLEKQMSAFGETVVTQLAESSKEPILAEDVLTLEFVLNNLISADNIHGAALYTEELKPIARAGTTPIDLMAIPLIKKDEPLRWRRTDMDKPVITMLSFPNEIKFRDLTIGYALITFDNTVMESATQKAIRMIIGASLLLIMFGIAASIIIGNRLTRPIYQLIDASRSISEGNYNFRFSERRNDELGHLMDALNTMTEGLLRKEQVEETFSRYVSPNVAKQVLKDLDQVHLGGHHVEASVLFADIVGFTSMSEEMSPKDVNALLNEYFDYIAQAALAYNGHIDKYIGDCAMLVFGVPEKDPEHSFHAVGCAILIQRIMEALNIVRIKKGLPSIHFRMGVNSGTMLAGNMGAQSRMEYTVVGDAVNLASRLSSAAEGDEIIISEEMLNRGDLAKRIISEQHTTLRLRGKKEPVATYRITGIGEKEQKHIAKALAGILKMEPQLVHKA